MDTDGVVRRPRRIAGGDHDGFDEGEDGEKLPEVDTTKNNPPRRRCTDSDVYHYGTMLLTLSILQYIYQIKNWQKIRARLASLPKCLHIGKILIVYITQMCRKGTVFF